MQAVMNGCTGAPTALEIRKKCVDAVPLVDSSNVDAMSVTKSLKRCLSLRLVSFKGLATATPKDLRWRALAPFLVVAGVQIGNLAWAQNGKFLTLQWENLANLQVSFIGYQRGVMCVVVLFLGLLLRFFFFPTRARTYLMDFTCFVPLDDYKMTKEAFINRAEASGFFNEKSLEFQRKILASSGLGEETYVPPSMHVTPPDLGFAGCLKEAKMVLFGVMDEILAKSGVKPQDIGILVVNCSVFCPTPSLSAMIVNQYKLPDDIEAYSLGGMGCSAGLIAISLARDLLKVNKNTYAVVMSAEVISGHQAYIGNDRSMMVGNCIFRWGASACLLSNKRSDWRKAKYELVHIVRTHKGADDKGFQCVKQVEDADGILGVSLSKELMTAAGLALTKNITTLARRILPISEKLKFASNFVARKLLKMDYNPYMPNFQKGIDHFCIHPGGKAILDEIEKSLQLPAHHMEPSRMTLHRWGNTSSSSIWYVLAYMEAKGRVQRGDLVWQIALGSGIKCNSAIWRAMKSKQRDSTTNPWDDCITQYPAPLQFTNCRSKTS